MVPKRPNLLEDSRSASSSEEEEEASDQENEGGDKEEQEEEGKQGAAQESESEYESESDSNTDLYVKPMNYETEHSQSDTASTSKPAAAAAAKRGADTDDDENDKKRAKTEDGKNHSQRVWSEEEEIFLLNEAIEYVESRGIDPTKDMGDFYDFIKKGLRIEVKLGQVKDKVWRLKNSFKNNVKKGKGEEKRFGKAHKQKVFEMSKMKWGREGIVGKGSEAKSLVKSDGKGWGIGKRLAGLKVDFGLDWDGNEGEASDKKGKNVVVEMENVGGVGKFHSSGELEEYVLRKGMELLDGSRKDEMKERLWKLHVKQLELFIKWNELVRKLAELLLAAYNKKDED